MGPGGEVDGAEERKSEEGMSGDDDGRTEFVVPCPNGVKDGEQNQPLEIELTESYGRDRECGEGVGRTASEGLDVLHNEGSNNMAYGEPASTVH